MIIIAELQMQGYKHVLVNKGMIRILKSTFRNDDFLLVCDELHLKSLDTQRLFNPNEFKTSVFAYKEGDDNKKNILKKSFREVAQAFQLFRKAKQYKNTLIVFLSVSPLTAPFINLFTCLFAQENVICLHGDLGVLSLKKNKVTTILLRRIIRLFFATRCHKRTVLLFYGEIIRKKFFERFPDFSNKNVLAIDHPYEFYPVQHHKPQNPVVIANIGTALMIKNSHLFFALGEKCARLVEGGRLTLRQIGNVSKQVQHYRNSNVELFGEKFLEDSSFERALGTADYFVYFFTNDSYYDLCPSGTFFDAIRYKKPIIALYNDFFNSYFNKLGDIGYLCSSIEEMYLLILEVANGSKLDEYEKQVSNLIRAEEILSINNITEDFRVQVSTLNVKYGGGSERKERP